MGTNSTNPLLLAGLHMAYSLSVGLAIAASHNFMQKVELVNSTKKIDNFSLFWWLLGSCCTGIVLLLMLLSNEQSLILLLVALVTTALILMRLALPKFTIMSFKLPIEHFSPLGVSIQHTATKIESYSTVIQSSAINQEAWSISNYLATQNLIKQLPLKINTKAINLLSTDAVQGIIATLPHKSNPQLTESSHEEKEILVSQLSEKIPGMIYQYLLKTDGSVSFPFISSGAREIYELEPTQIQQNASLVLDLIHPDDRESFDDSVAISAKTLKPWKWEGRFIWSSGKLKRLKAASKPELQDNGDILWNGILMDITESKQADLAWQEKIKQFQVIFEQADVAIAQVGTNGKFLQVNAKMCELTGYSQEELLQKTIWEITYPKDRAADKIYLEQFLSGQRETLKMEKRYIHKSGSLVWVNVSVSVVRSANGKPEYFMGVISDITAYKQTEATLKERDCEAWAPPNRLSSLAAKIGVALATQRQQAEEALLERSRLSCLAAEVGVALANGGSLSAILGCCTKAMQQHLDAISAAVWTLNPATKELEQLAVAGEPTVINPDQISLFCQQNPPYLSGEQLEQLHRTLILNNLSGYPLIVEDRLIGVMTVLGNQPITEEARQTLSWVANAISVAIDRYWARKELLSRRESLLFELANQIRNSLELDTILENAVQSIRSLLQIDRCNFIWYRRHEEPIYWEVVNEAKNPLLASHIGQYTTTEVAPFTQQLLTGQIIRIDEVKTFHDPALQDLLLTNGYTSILSIPVETKLGEIGVICCGHCTGTRAWDDSEVELLQAVVAQLAIALDQAELYAQARQAARTAVAQAQELELAIKQLQTAQIQLVHSEKMSSLGQLVAGVAHEINNPVNFIHGNLTYASAYFHEVLGLLRLYQEYFPNPPAVIQEEAEAINIEFISQDVPKLLSSMHRGTERIRSIVLSLRNFSRLDEAEMKIADINEGIENTLLILQHRLKSKDKHPEIQVFKEYGDLPPIECYPGQLNQVFLNILSNAVEAFELTHNNSHKKSSPAITIQTNFVDSSNSKQKSPKIVIRIADNGPGMTEEVQSRLFDPFFTTKPVGQGTGLGLSISYQIVVQHHHGVLTCTSAPGQGAEFCIEIPLQQIN